jgi:hypothetical protein
MRLKTTQKGSRQTQGRLPNVAGCDRWLDRQLVGCKTEFLRAGLTMELLAPKEAEAAQQNSVAESAAAHDVNASDFGWANLKRSCHGTEQHPLTK